jgi:hypothetical protein
VNPSPDQDFLDRLADKLRDEQAKKNGSGDPQTNGHGRPHQAAGAAPSDEAVIERCRAAKNAAKFADLFDGGDVHRYHGGDDSVADLALLGILKLYTQDAAQLERIFSASALGKRSKWRDRPDYRRRTIEHALSNAGEVYDWHPNGATRERQYARLGEGRSESPTGTGTGTPNSNGTGTGRRRLTSTAFVDMPTPEPRRYLVEGIVPEAYPTMIYGDGGVAKSMLALSLGLGVASNAGTWLGHRIESGGVLYLDFELDAAEQNRRVSRLARAEGLEGPPRMLRYMSAVGVRARDAFEDALIECKEHDTRLLVVDSLGPALEGDAEASRDVISFYNEVVGPFRLAGVAPLVIDHQSKMQAGDRYQNKRAFGSVFKSNLARSVLQVEATDRSDGELTVRIRQNKHNFGPLLKPFGAHLTFSEEEVRIEAVDLEEADLAEEGTLNARERVRLALQALGEATRAEIHEQVTDLSPGTVKKELIKLCGSGVAEWTGEARERQQVARLTGTGTGTYKGTGTGSGGSEPPMFGGSGGTGGTSTSGSTSTTSTGSPGVEYRSEEDGGDWKNHKALEALADESSGVRETVLDCLDGKYDKDHKTGASVYQGGSLGVVAGALAKYHGEAANPGAWKDWMEAATLLVDAVANE